MILITHEQLRKALWKTMSDGQPCEVANEDIALPACGECMQPHHWAFADGIAPLKLSAAIFS